MYMTDSVDERKNMPPSPVFNFGPGKLKSFNTESLKVKLLNAYSK